MAKRIILEEGMLLSIWLSDTKWTLCQVCNIFRLEGQRYQQDTLAFFNYVFDSEEELIANIDKLDLSKPIMIATVNGHPIRTYKLDVIGKREINYLNVPNYKDNICNIGLYNEISFDFDDILAAYFGLFPWDAWAWEGYMDISLLPDAPRRPEIKYMKDFSIEELKNIMPARSPKLIKLLEEHGE